LGDAGSAERVAWVEQGWGGGGTNGTELNHGQSDTGAPATEVDGAGTPGTSADGSSLAGLVLDGSMITSTRVGDGVTVSGDELVGATFTAETPSGSPVDVHIADLEVIPSEYSTGVVAYYTILSRDGATSSFVPICGTKDGAAVRAIPLAGRWSYGRGVPGGGSKIPAPGWLTFACEGYALAKCVEAGYEPWRTTAGGVSLEAHHQACTRMIRADYCGDGRSYTVNGTLIGVYDSIGIQFGVEGGEIEAEWDEQGARCLRRPRAPGTGSPDCVFELSAVACGAPPHWTDTLLVSEAW
jgi:hypothetical protein